MFRVVKNSQIAAPRALLAHNKSSLAAAVPVDHDEFKVFNEVESKVNFYGRTNKAVFVKAQGSEMFDAHGKRYMDFFSAAGSLNYGHNHPVLVKAHIDFLKSGAMSQCMDMYTPEKEKLLCNLRDIIMEPRGLKDFKVQFCGPTGTNAVEAALKLARINTGRSTIVNFTNSYHGMTMGALSVSGNTTKRRGMGMPTLGNHCEPFDGYDGADGMQLLHSFDHKLSDTSSGVAVPAGVIVEVIQGEGGINSCSNEWLRKLREICTNHGIVMIVDEIQTGVGRTGKFFSFEHAGIVPDCVTLSKSISGDGSPLAIIAFRPDLDIWKPGEHNGTFRGFQPGYASANAAMEHFWSTPDFEHEVARKSKIFEAGLQEIATATKGKETECFVKGKGFFRGLGFVNHKFAEKAKNELFHKGLLVETCGPHDSVMKIFPALNMPDDILHEGLGVLGDHVVKMG